MKLETLAQPSVTWMLVLRVRLPTVLVLGMTQNESWDPAFQPAMSGLPSPVKSATSNPSRVFQPVPSETNPANDGRPTVLVLRHASTGPTPASSTKTMASGVVSFSK